MTLITRCRRRWNDRELMERRAPGREMIAHQHTHTHSPLTPHTTHTHHTHTHTTHSTTHTHTHHTHTHTTHTTHPPHTHTHTHTPPPHTHSHLTHSDSHTHAAARLSLIRSNSLCGYQRALDRAAYQIQIDHVKRIQVRRLSLSLFTHHPLHSSLTPTPWLQQPGRLRRSAQTRLQAVP